MKTEICISILSAVTAYCSTFQAADGSDCELCTFDLCGGIYGAVFGIAGSGDCTKFGNALEERHKQLLELASCSAELGDCLETNITKIQEGQGELNEACLKRLLIFECDTSPVEATSGDRDISSCSTLMRTGAQNSLQCENWCQSVAETCQGTAAGNIDVCYDRCAEFWREDNCAELRLSGVSIEGMEGANVNYIKSEPPPLINNRWHYESLEDTSLTNSKEKQQYFIYSAKVFYPLPHNQWVIDTDQNFDNGILAYVDSNVGSPHLISSVWNLWNPASDPVRLVRLEIEIACLDDVEVPMDSFVRTAPSLATIAICMLFSLTTGTSQLASLY